MILTFSFVGQHKLTVDHRSLYRTVHCTIVSNSKQLFNIHRKLSKYLPSFVMLLIFSDSPFLC